MSEKKYRIELRCHFMDEGKYDAILPLIREAAALLYANVSLLQDGIKPRIALLCDDSFIGHEEIKLIEATTVAKGVAMLEEAGDTSEVYQPSDELLAAVSKKL